MSEPEALARAKLILFAVDKTLALHLIESAVYHAVLWRRRVPVGVRKHQDGVVVELVPVSGAVPLMNDRFVEPFVAL